MFRSTTAHAPTAKSLARAARTMEDCVNITPEATSCRTRAYAAANDMPWAAARSGDQGRAVRVARHEPSLEPSLSPDVAIEDWDILLSAVKARLRQSVGAPLAAMPATPVPDTADQVRASVLDCVEALDQLHATQQHEFSRCQRLARELIVARTALAQTRAELAGTQIQERHARHLARHDSLTSLPNRRFFGERLDHVLAHTEAGRPALAVLYLDLDGFKPINDTYGHATGDELLRIVAARLTQTLRADDLVSRLGGDEFACLLRDLPNQEQLGHLACKLFDAISAPIQIGPFKLTVRPSIGIAVRPAEGASAEALLKNADLAMYRAKRQQTGYAFFETRADVGAPAAESLSNS